MNTDDVHILELDLSRPENTKARAIVELTRRLAARHGHSDVSVEFFLKPHPAGLAVLGSPEQIWLSLPFVELSDFAPIANLILHEVCHLLTPGDLEHGDLWRQAAARLRVKDLTPIASESYKRLVRIFVHAGLAD
jgi:hypothetical protein